MKVDRVIDKYEIDKEIAMTVFLKWETKKDMCLLNTKTNEKKTFPLETLEVSPYSGRAYTPNDDFISCVRNRHGVIRVAGTGVVKQAYAKYHENKNLLEVSIISVSKLRTGEHEYKRDAYILVDKNKNIIEKDFGYYDTNCRYKKSYRSFMSELVRLDYNYDLFSSEFRKLLGSNFFTKKSGRKITWLGTYGFREWMNCKISTPSKNIIKFDGDDLDLKNCSVFEKINDEMFVIRHCDCYGEDQRFFVFENDNKVQVQTKNENGEWIVIYKSALFGWDYTHSMNTLIKNRDEMWISSQKMNRIKDFVFSETFCDDDIENINMLYVVNFVCHPILEQLYKVIPDIKLTNIKSSRNINERLKEFFPKYNKNEKSIKKALSLNIDKINLYIDKIVNSSAGYTYKEAMRVMCIAYENINSMSLQQFEEKLKMTDYVLSKCWSLRYNARSDKLKNAIEKCIKIKNANEYTYQNALEAYCDALNSFENLDHQRKIASNFENVSNKYDDIIRCHDTVVMLKHHQDEERRAMWDMDRQERLKKLDEKRKDIDETRKKFEYEDDNFVIRLPKDNNELIREGSLQRICIGSYTDRHSEGVTNIFLLRNKNDLECPFYAIEMDNDKSIVQIHGFCNKWLGNNPEAIPTVVRWLRSHDISCSKDILLCKSTGYGKTNSYLEPMLVDGMAI